MNALWILFVVALAFSTVWTVIGVTRAIRFGMGSPPVPKGHITAPVASEERPAIPQDFKPAKQIPRRRTRPVSDRMIRQVRVHAREVHGLDQEGPRS